MEKGRSSHQILVEAAEGKKAGSASNQGSVRWWATQEQAMLVTTSWSSFARMKGTRWKASEWEGVGEYCMEGILLNPHGEDLKVSRPNQRYQKVRCVWINGRGQEWRDAAAVLRGNSGRDRSQPVSIEEGAHSFQSCAPHALRSERARDVVPAPEACHFSDGSPSVSSAGGVVPSSSDLLAC